MIGELIKIKPEQLPEQRAAKRKKKPALWRRRWVRFLFYFMVLASLAGYVAFLVITHGPRKRALEFDLTRMDQFEVSTLVHDRNGKDIGEMAEESRRTVSLDQIPHHFIQALLAAEDSRFYDHKGVDYWGIARATYWTYIRKTGSTQGGSTITQQLARQTYKEDDPSMLDKTIERKLTEIFLALRIEKNFTKSQILEMYLNRVYFGSGCWGVNAAAIRYFGKGVKDLTLSESATLCGLIKSPNKYSPLNDLAAAKRNRNIVFERMVDENFLSREEADKLSGPEIVLHPTVTAKGGGYVLDQINAELTPILESLGVDMVAGKGLHIHTSLDADLQKAAEVSVAQRMEEIEKRKEYVQWVRDLNLKPERKEHPRLTFANFSATYEMWQRAARDAVKNGREPPEELDANYLQAAAMVLDNKTGDILAMVGGRDWHHNKVNLAQSKPGHAPGTAFFPFVYAAAFEDKMFPGTRLSDKPLDNSRIMVGSIEGILGEWGREGQTGEFLGQITARGALVQSMNGASARLGLDLGLPKIQDFAKRAGIEDLSDLKTSILGASECSLRELTHAYTTFPNGGKRSPHVRLVTKITDSKGRTLWSRPADEPMVKVTDEITAYMVTSCLEDALSIGTGSPAKDYGLKDFACAGKSGTHYEFRDLTFAGFTSRVTCGVWVGMRDRPETIYPSAFSNQCALPIWTDIMNAAASKIAPEPFNEPPNIERVDLCASSGLRATDHCFQVQEDTVTKRRMNVKTTYQEYMRPGFRLDQLCDVHGAGRNHERLKVPTLPFISTSNTNERIKINVNPIPVPLKAPVVVGNDPYLSVQAQIAGEVSKPQTPGQSSGQPTVPILETPDISGKDKLQLPEPQAVNIQ